MPHEIRLNPALEDGNLLTHALENVLKPYSFSTFSIGIRSNDAALKVAYREQLQHYVSTAPFWKSKKLVLDAPHVNVLLDLVLNAFIVDIFPQIVIGRYCKLQRGIAQTRHFCYQCKGRGKWNGKVCDVCKGEKVLTKESVQELIAPFFEKAFSAQEILFHGAGREDVDVRMLGNGRPFALTIENPFTRKVDLVALQEKINTALKGKVGLLELELASPDAVAKLTQAYHNKRYRALVHAEKVIQLSRLNAFLNQKMDVIQTTPTRVEKRRVMKERPHWIVVEKVVSKNLHEVELFLYTSAGCYIKEFISGDNGRSIPSVAEWLGIPCGCKELDVLEIVDSISH